MQRCRVVIAWDSGLSTALRPTRVVVGVATALVLVRGYLGRRLLIGSRLTPAMVLKGCTRYLLGLEFK